MIITYEKAVTKNSYCILEGEGLEVLNYKNARIANILDKIPMNFSKISEILIKELGYLSYINFWHNVKIIQQNC